MDKRTTPLGLAVHEDPGQLTFGGHQEPIKKRQKTVLTLSASLVTHSDALNTAIISGLPKSQLYSAAASASVPDPSLEDDGIKGDVPPPPPPLHATGVEAHLEQQILPSPLAGSAVPAPHLGIGLADLTGPDASAIVIPGVEASWLASAPSQLRALNALPSADAAIATSEHQSAGVLMYVTGAGGEQSDLLHPPPVPPPPPTDPSAADM